MSDDKKNPLDVLEELLKDTGNGAVSGSGSNNSDPSKPVEKTKEELERELEQKRIEFEQSQEEQKRIDDQKLIKQRQAISGIQDSQEYKARVQQDSAKKDDEEKQTVASDGFEIDQLGHKKV
ncbi:MAG: hypothetical protein H6772_04235 [Pseudomonadales bacterium]|nr:hypothetical protein [Pseudomonadales bacterium]